MSLKFLAVGQSFAGLRGDKSPFAVRKENQLPNFPSNPRFKGKSPQADDNVMVQTDFLQGPSQTDEPEAGVVNVIAPAGPFQKSTPLAVAAAKPKKSWFSFFRFKWFRSQPSKVDLIQSELSLEKVRVMRNDLADSDLRLVLKKKKKVKNVFAANQENNALPRQGWSELTARLFELGQK
jgi:hypothetical protein